MGSPAVRRAALHSSCTSTGALPLNVPLLPVPYNWLLPQQNASAGASGLGSRSTSSAFSLVLPGLPVLVLTSVVQAVVQSARCSLTLLLTSCLASSGLDL